MACRPDPARSVSTDCHIRLGRTTFPSRLVGRYCSAMFFGLRFDFRNPEIGGVSMADRYAAALDMVEWADQLGGCMTVAVSEHHGSDDGYLPSPLLMLSAMAARTTNVRFMVAALITSFYDPLRLAEDLVVLDNISRGRVDLVLGSGYVPSEFEMYGVPSSERAKRLTETMETLRAAFTGEPFEFRGRTVQVTPSARSRRGPGPDARRQQRGGRSPGGPARCRVHPRVSRRVGVLPRRGAGARRRRPRRVDRRRELHPRPVRRRRARLGAARAVLPPRDECVRRLAARVGRRSPVPRGQGHRRTAHCAARTRSSRPTSSSPR